MNENAAIIIFMGLLLNGCFQQPSRIGANINENDIIDEREIGDAMKEAACLFSGRNWTVFDKCE